MLAIRKLYEKWQQKRHMIWKEGLENVTLTGPIESRRDRERQLICVNKLQNMHLRDRKGGDLLRIIDNRKLWKVMIAHVLKRLSR